MKDVIKANKDVCKLSWKPALLSKHLLLAIHLTIFHNRFNCVFFHKLFMDRNKKTAHSSTLWMRSCKLKLISRKMDKNNAIDTRYFFSKIFEVFNYLMHGVYLKKAIKQGVGESKI